MRIYEVTLKRQGEEKKGKALSFISEVEDHQRSDDAMHAAMVAHPDMVATNVRLVSRGQSDSCWPMLAQGMVH